MTSLEQILVLSLLGLPFDLFNCFLAIRHNRQEKAASPLPVVTLIIHGCCLCAPIFKFGIIIKVLAFILATCFHILFLSIVPGWEDKLFDKK